MARFRNKQPEPAPEPEPRRRRALTAAASVISDPRSGMAAYRARAGEDAWQKAAWAYYDSVGELNAAVKWLANAVSLADMYAAEVDPETGLTSEATDNRTVQAVVNTILGGPVKRAQAQATMVTNWLVAGEFFTVVTPKPQGDKWYVLSSTEVSERGGEFKYCDPTTGQQVPVSGRDLIMRTWNPHPRFQSHADSSVRSAVPILAEVERTTMNIAARLDSRLAGSGILWVPEEADFPITDQDAEEDEDSLLGLLQRTTAASLANPGQAESQVPLMVPMRSDLIETVTHTDFTTEMSQEIIDLRDNAIKRLAMALDIPPEILTGMADTNHWSAWQIEESTYKIHVAPLLDRIGDALTETYLVPQLTRMGVPTPERYVLKFSTQDIIARPDRFDELTQLYTNAVISEDYYRSELSIPDAAVPGEEETKRRLAITLLTQAPSLATTVPELLQLAGFGDVVPAAGTDQAEIADAPGPDEPVDTEPEQRAIPQQSEPSDGLTAAAELMVYDALSRAGGRLLTRGERGQHGDTEKYALHTVIDGSSRAGELLEGSFQFVSPTAASFGLEPASLERKLRRYCRDRITSRAPHDREELRRWLSL